MEDEVTDVKDDVVVEVGYEEVEEDDVEEAKYVYDNSVAVLVSVSVYTVVYM